MHSDEVTRIGNNNLLMVGVHIGHDCVIEDNIVMSNFTQLSGHCKIEKGALAQRDGSGSSVFDYRQMELCVGTCRNQSRCAAFCYCERHYPLRVRGINKRGLTRAGLNEEQQKKIFDAYKRLYRSNKAAARKRKGTGCRRWNR